MNRFLFVIFHLSFIIFNADICCYAAAPELGIFGDTIGVRNAVFGSAFTAIANDNNAMLINPAGLAQFNWHELGLTYQKGIVDTSRSFVSYSHVFGNRVVGFGLAFFDAGSIDIYDTTEGKLRTVKAATDFLAMFNGALRFGFAGVGIINCGLGIKILGTTLAERYSTSAFLLDTGLLLEIFKGKIAVGSSLRNLGTQISYQGLAKESLPLNLDVALLAKIIRSKQHYLILAMGTEMNDLLTPASHRSPLKIDFGTEYLYNNMLIIRGGYKYVFPSKLQSYGVGQMSVGGGIRFKAYQLDYSWTGDAFWGDKHQVSVTMKFRSAKQKDKTTTLTTQLQPNTTTQTIVPETVTTPEEPVTQELTPSTTTQTQPMPETKDEKPQFKPLPIVPVPAKK